MSNNVGPTLISVSCLATTCLGNRLYSKSDWGIGLTLFYFTIGYHYDSNNNKLLLVPLRNCENLF